MKVQRQIALCLLALSSTFVGAQTAKVDPVERNLRQHVEYLSSDRLEGRRTGEYGATMAAAYVADQFAKLKLRPGSRDNNRPSFYQRFPFVTGVDASRSGNTLVLEYNDRTGERMRVADTIDAKPIGFSPSGKVAGTDIVFVGYGIVSRESNFDDYANRA